MEPVVDISMETISEAIISGVSDVDVMATFHSSGMSLEDLTKWRHPLLSVNMFQIAILYKRADLVQSLGTICPFFLSDRSLYKEQIVPDTNETLCVCSRGQISEDSDVQDSGDSSRQVPNTAVEACQGEASRSTQGQIPNTSSSVADASIQLVLVSTDEQIPNTSPGAGSSSPPEKSDSTKEDTSSDQDGGNAVILNPPLHLACMVGCIGSIKYLLEKPSSFSLNEVANVSIAVRDGESETANKYYTLPMTESRRGKPFEFCVSGGHVDFAFYFLNNIIIQCLALRFLYAGVREPSSMLHKACSIGCGPLVDLLLKNSFRDVISLSDKNGKTPLHVAVWNGDTDTIHHLLECGASVNALTESKGCLHILYRSKLHPYNYIANTKLLIQFGINVHITDKNGKSALHILAEEIGISRTDVMRYWKKASNAIREMTSSKSNTIGDNYSMSTYQSDLITCLELLLEKGMNPNKVTTKSAFNETVLEVLLQYSSLPYTQTTLWNSPQIVYRAVELLLSHGTNPNLPSRCSDLPIFTYFIMNHLNDIPVGDKKMKHKFIHLFSLYGANFDHPAMNGCYPLVAAVEKQTCQNVLELIGCLMDMEHLHHAMMTVQQRFLPPLIYSNKLKEVEFAYGVVELFEKLRIRSLRHLCKVTILKQLTCAARDVEQLPLPNYLKSYITTASF
ncbi:ankyrin-1-like [Haliotis rubra]|uniref:ankyrin-1-like n=1 Tax=Haliotis rubra TaxID=36100 RepID=UPI001EE57BA8|nr:ankyrin-1-like [Haliotis rubra]